MSRIVPSVVACPHCGAACTVRVFESLNGDRIPAQVAAILDGSFERTACTACQGAFQPEHPMLYVRFTARTWLVMYPLAARLDYAGLEADISGVLARNFADAPGILADGLRGIRPRLVFGHYALCEALRAQRDAIDPPLLECTKLLAYRDNVSPLFALGPCELVYVRTEGDDARLVFDIRSLPSAQPLGELSLPAKVLGEARALLPRFATSHAELFERPYISALRYLYRA